MSTTSERTPGAHRIKAFGPGDALLGVTSGAKPRRDATIGAVLWGLGVAEMKTARRLMQYGIPALQIRINGDAFADDDRRNEIYRTHGVAYCRVAMDRLAAEQGASSFILMGNCACANLCFNAALEDERIAGIILTNPYVAKFQLVRSSPFYNVGRVWKKLLAGQLDIRSLWRAARALAAPAAPTARARGAPRLELPNDFDRRLRALCDRGVKVLIACSSSDDSRHYLASAYGRALAHLEAEDKLSFRVVDSSAHVFSTDDAAAALLNDTISAWVDATYAVADGPDGEGEPELSSA